MPVRPPLGLVPDALAEGLAVPVGEPDPVELGEEETVGEGDVVVGDGDVATGVGDGDVAVPLGPGVAVGLTLVAVELGVLDGVADGQSGAVAE